VSAMVRRYAGADAGSSWRRRDSHQYFPAAKQASRAKPGESR